MIINIEEIENLPESQVSLQFNEIIDSLSNKNHVHGTITIMSLGQRILVEGNVQTNMILECDRCLESYTCHMNVEVSETFLKGALDSELKKDFELTEESFLEELGDNKEIDISNLLYQEIILNIPSQKLCKDSCEGNEHYKSLINEKRIDSRLEVFKTYFDKNND